MKIARNRYSEGLFQKMGMLLLGMFCILSAAAASSSAGAFFHLTDGIQSVDKGWQDPAVPFSGCSADLSACEEEENEDDGDPLLSRGNRPFHGLGSFVTFGGRLCVTLVPHAKRYLLYCSLRIAC